MHVTQCSCMVFSTSIQLKWTWSTGHPPVTTPHTSTQSSCFHLSHGGTMWVMESAWDLLLPTNHPPMNTLKSNEQKGLGGKFSMMIINLYSTPIFHTLTYADMLMAESCNLLSHDEGCGRQFTVPPTIQSGFPKARGSELKKPFECTVRWNVFNSKKRCPVAWTERWHPTCIFALYYYHILFFF